MRQFVQEYIQALNCQNAGLEVVKEFIRRYAMFLYNYIIVFGGWVEGGGICLAAKH